MNLTDVVETLVEERGLDKEQVVSVIGEGMLAAYAKKYPELELTAHYNAKTGQLEVQIQKEVVSSVQDEDAQITVRRARTFKPKAKAGDIITVPFDKPVGRIEISAAKQVIASRIRELEQLVIYEKFKDKLGSIIAGTVHKKERAGFTIKIGEIIALLPTENMVPNESLRVGMPIRVLLKEVLESARSNDYQLILDRASSDFVCRLVELEIPEVFDGIVEIKNIARTAGYKTKIVVESNSSDIDPVGTCVGVGGSRIKPILRELGGEKIDLIPYTEDPEELVKDSLKPAEIDKVEVQSGGENAIVWLAKDQRSYAIGRGGQNITLASRLTGINIQLQDVIGTEGGLLSFDDDETEHESVEKAIPAEAESIMEEFLPEVERTSSDEQEAEKTEEAEQNEEEEQVDDKTGETEE